ncbi:MAG: cytidine deaminase [Chloroflexi bacterium]|nr:cytidine deaminase [Chloroflexota bacterium]
MEIDWSELEARARRVARHAYQPYSGLSVGAAVLGSNGTIYAGCNVENASYGLTLCAERVAASTAVAGGGRPLLAIVVVGSGADPVPPCGACRQFLWELGPQAPIRMVGSARTVEAALADLLPGAFSRHNLPPGRPR